MRNLAIFVVPLETSNKSFNRIKMIKCSDFTHKLIVFFLLKTPLIIDIALHYKVLTPARGHDDLRRLLHGDPGRQPPQPDQADSREPRPRQQAGEITGSVRLYCTPVLVLYTCTVL